MQLLQPSIPLRCPVRLCLYALPTHTFSAQLRGGLPTSYLFRPSLLLYSCNDPDVSGIETCVGNFTSPVTGVVLNRTWTNPWPNFDNVGNSLIVCFLVVTLNGYTTVMMEVREGGA